MRQHWIAPPTRKGAEPGAVRASGTLIDGLFFSGPCSSSNVEGVGSPDTEVAAIFESMQLLLEQAGMDLQDVVRVRFWSSDGVIPSPAIEAYRRAFPDAGSSPVVNVAQKSLAAGSGVEIELVAVAGGTRQSFGIGSRGDFYPAICVKDDVFCVSGLRSAVEHVGASSEDDAASILGALATALEAAEISADGVGHLLVWYRDHAFRDVVNGPFTELFPILGDRPARHSVVRAMPGEEGLRIEATGVVGSRRACYTISGVWHAGIAGMPNSLPFGTRTGRLLFSAATYGQDPDTQQCGGAENQIDFAFRHTAELLSAAGLDLTHIAHAFLWIREDAYRDMVEEAWCRVFPDAADRPASHVITSELPRDFLVQIEITAVVPAGTPMLSAIRP